jgi:hypothetical protein
MQKPPCFRGLNWYGEVNPWLREHLPAGCSWEWWRCNRARPDSPEPNVSGIAGASCGLVPQGDGGNVNSLRTLRETLTDIHIRETARILCNPQRFEAHWGVYQYTCTGYSGTWGRMYWSGSHVTNWNFELLNFWTTGLLNINCRSGIEVLENTPFRKVGLFPKNSVFSHVTPCLF